MALTKYFLDKRRPRTDGSFPLVLAFCKGCCTRLIPLGLHVKPQEWDGQKIVGRKKSDSLNAYIAGRKQKVDELLLRLKDERPPLSATQIKERILDEIDPEKKQASENNKLFVVNFQRFTALHGKRTQELYKVTLNHLQKFMGEKLKRLRFENITREWLTDFDNYLARTSPSRNARNIHLRNIRAVVNYAIDNGITTTYAFRKFKIKQEETVKRSLTVEQLRQLFNYPLDEFQNQYVDMFKLMFFLCGINMIDLYNLQAVVDGRVSYHRCKTHKLYSIKIEPEAMEIIKRYKGKKKLLNIADRYVNHHDYMQRMNRTLQHVGEYQRVGRGGKKVFKPLFPDLTTYWARHTWATIAAELDIPNETIAAALGHEFGNRTTAIYIRFDQKKVDEANRKVIDYVLGKNDTTF